MAGYSKRQNETAKQSWEQTRQLMFAVLSPNLKDKSLQPHNVIAFPWDEKKEEIDIQSEVEAAEENKKYWELMDSKAKKTEVFKM